MPIELNDNVKIKAGKPAEPKSFYSDNKAYLNTAQVLATVPVAERHEYLPVNVAGVQYWFLPDLVTLVKIPANITVDVPLTFINGVVSISYDPLTLEILNSKIQVKHGVYPELDAQGKVPAINLPGVIPDVIEVANFAALPAVGISAVIYITVDDLKQYRWGGSVYALLSASLVLGDLSSNAYPGNKGKIAYDHTFNTANPHATTKAQIGLSSADNTSDINKPVSTAQQIALDLKSNTTHGHTIPQVDQLTEALAARVVGPAGSANNVICIFDGTTGKLIKVTNVTIDANGQMVINAQGVGLTAISDYVGIEGNGIGAQSFGLTGKSPNIPIQGCTMDVNGTGKKRVIVMRGDSANTLVAAGYGLNLEVFIPLLGWSSPGLSETTGGILSFVIKDPTAGAEKVDIEFYTMRNGTLVKQATLTNMGQYQINSLKLNPLATPPENPDGGEMYHNTNGHVYKFNAQSLVWDDMTAAASAGGPEVALTSNDGSVIIDKYDLSVNNQQVVEVGPGLQQGFGLYYNGHVANKKHINSDGLVIGDAVAAENWHISNNDDWNDLIVKCGGLAHASAKLKQAGNLTWFPQHAVGADVDSDLFGFTAFPEGVRSGTTGLFLDKGDRVGWWTGDVGNNKVYHIEHEYAELFINTTRPLTQGHSLRLVRNFTALTVQGQKGEYIGNDGKKYITVLIGTKEWLTADLAETKWRDGSLIPVYAGLNGWHEHTTAAVCAWSDNWNYITSEATQSVVGPKETLKFVGGENINVSQNKVGGVLEVVIDYIGIDPVVKVYSGIHSQIGTANPTRSIFKNDILAPDWVRTVAGTYTLTKVGAFPAWKTIPVKEEDYTDSDGNLFKLIWTSADVMTLKTYAAVNTDILADGVLVNRYIYIEIN